MFLGSFLFIFFDFVYFVLFCFVVGLLLDCFWCCFCVFYLGEGGVLQFIFRFCLLLFVFALFVLECFAIFGFSLVVSFGIVFVFGFCVYWIGLNVVMVLFFWFVLFFLFLLLMKNHCYSVFPAILVLFGWLKNESLFFISVFGY